MPDRPIELAVFAPADGATNFARDEAMLERARAEQVELIRIYAWDRAVVSFGRNERVVGRFDPTRIEAAGLDAARRPTGGRALLHAKELTYAMAGPADQSDTLRCAFDRISHWLVGALRRLGVNTTIERNATTPQPDGAPCFAMPSRGELVVGTRKLVASAQWREANAYLQHGSVLIDNDQSRLAECLVAGIAFPPVPSPATLRELLPHVPTTEDFAGALMQYFAEIGVAIQRVDPGTMLDVDKVGRLVDRYRDGAWTWRR